MLKGIKLVFGLAMVVLATSVTVASIVYITSFFLSTFTGFDIQGHDTRYRKQKAKMARSEATQLWYDRQHLDLEARRQCIHDPKCNYFSLRPADNFTGGNTFHPKPWEQKINLKVKSDVTHRTERKRPSADKPKKPSTKFSRQMADMPESEKTWLRKAGEHPVVDYWLGNGFGH